MAIDDNTSYELTGYQVKDLAGRIRLKADASAIPTVNDATLTLVQNGTTVGTFTANQSTNTTANIETIYSVDVSSTQPVTQVVSTAMIQDEAVTTAKIDDEAVTAAKIDWSTLTDESSYFRLGNLLVQFGTYDFGTQSFSNDYWGSMRRSDRQDNHIVWPIEFADDPYFVGIWPSTSGQIAVSSVGGTRTQSSNFAALAPTSYTGSAAVEGYWIAIGPAE